MRTLVVGLDGVCLPVLEPMIEDGLLPNIANFRDRSAVGTLESQLPPWTPSAWPSLYTGVNPGKHGVYDFLHFDGYDWDVVNRSRVKEYAVWELLSMNGHDSVVVNVPVTHPPREFDGALVPGYIAPEEPDCHPEGTWDELNRELGEYRVYADDESREPGDAYEELLRMRGAAFRHLVEERDPDFGFVQFQQTDTVYHEHPDDEETIRRVYSVTDEEVGKIIEACDPDITLLVSDHGLGPMEGREFRVNEFLRDEGFVTATAGEGGMPSWASISRKKLREGEESGPVEKSAAERALELAARAGLTSQRIGAVLRTLKLDDLALKIAPMDVVRAGTERVDFEGSSAYMRSRTEMGVRINLEGREPEGVVPKSDYEEVRQAAIDALEKVETPGGERVFERVLPRESVFDGPYVDDAPDILIVPNRFDHYLSASLRGDTFDEPTEPWEHKLDGVVMAAGDGIDPGTNLRGAHLFDIAPTILATFGLPAGERMDGSTLPIAESTGTTDYPPFDPDDAVATDDESVERRLANLGYLE